MFNFLRPVIYMPMDKADINRPDKAQRGDRTARTFFNPYPVGTSYYSRTNPAQAAKLQKLAASWQKDTGRPGGLDTLWTADFDGGQHDGDDPLWSMAQARRWNILQGDYLADKGFRIHSLLHRFHAGLYKPPHRLRGHKQLTTDGVRTTMVVANMRIHVERGMRRGREFHTLNKPVPIPHLDLAGTEAFVAFMLGNLGPGLTGKDFFEEV